MEIIIISLILLLYFIAMIVSEIKQITMFTAIGEVALAMWNYVTKIYQIIFHKDDMISFPTSIGFDANGAFIPCIAEDEFSELKSIFDGLYLSNFECQTERRIRRTPCQEEGGVPGISKSQAGDDGLRYGKI